MDELEALKQKRLRELQSQAEGQMQAQQEAAQLQQQIGELEQLARAVLDKEAMQRYGTLKTAHPDKAIHALVVIAQLVQQKKLKHLDDQAFKDLLRSIEPEKKEFTITRR